MLDDRDLTARAALNNAQWCAAIWRLHDLRVEQQLGLWFTRGRAPALYPNAVAVDPDADRAAQTRFLAELAAHRPGFTVKDSFAELPLDTVGFRPLFDARWLWRDRVDDAGAVSPWRRVVSAPELEAWQRAWSSGDTTVGPFRATLLADPRVVMLAAMDGDGVIGGGGIAYEAAGVAGVTNLFGDTQGFLSAVARHSRAEHVVCYESGAQLQRALAHGFRLAAGLRVWTHYPGP